MKMETVVTAPVSGRINMLSAGVGDNMLAGDLLVEIDPTGDED